MGLFDKISNLIFVEEQDDNVESEKITSSSSKKGGWTDIFFKDVSTEESPKKKKESFLDIFFVEDSDDEIKSTFVEEDEKTSVLNDISSQIDHRESELINLAAFLKAVNPKDYPDSGPEYEAYLSLEKQLNEIKELSSSIKNSTVDSMRNYQLDTAFRKFELDYKAHINSIKSLCYLSEISILNTEMKELFSSDFTSRTGIKIMQTEKYINLISQKSDKFDKKYSARLYKALIEAEYRLTLLKLMNELKNDRVPRRNPFESFSPKKKKIFETYISKDLREANVRYNTIADGKEKYTEYNLVTEELFNSLDDEAEIISDEINKYTIDDFLLNELFDNGDGFETLKRFLEFKLNLNFIDSKTSEAEARFLDDNYRKAASSHNGTSRRRFSNHDDYGDR